MASNNNFENHTFQQQPGQWHHPGYPGVNFAHYNEAHPNAGSAQPFTASQNSPDFQISPYYSQLYDAPEPHAQERHDPSSGFSGFSYSAEAPSSVLPPHSQTPVPYSFTQGFRPDSQNSFTGDVYAVSSPSYTHQHIESPFQSPDVSQTPRRTESAPNFNHPQFPSPEMSMRPEDQQPAYPERQGSAGLNGDDESMSPMSDHPSPRTKPKSRFQSQGLSKKPTGVKKNHNQIERDYRTKLNDNVWSLGELAIDGIIKPPGVWEKKHPKKLIVETARDVIISLKKETSRQQKELTELKTRFAILEHTHHQLLAATGHQAPR